MQLEDAYNNPGATSTIDQTVTLSTTSAGGAFYASMSGGSPITSALIPAGQSSVTFYYEDTIAGDPTVTAADAALGSTPTQTEVIVAASANTLAITSSPLSLIVGTRGAMTVQLEDQYGNPATATTAQTVTLSTTSVLGTFYVSQSSPTPITSVVIPAGQSGATVYYGDDAVGTPTVTVADSAIERMAEQQETVNSVGVATQIAITSTALTLVAGNTGEVTLALEDAGGNPGATSTTDQTIALGTTSAVWRLLRDFHGYDADHQCRDSRRPDQRERLLRRQPGRDTDR